MEKAFNLLGLFLGLNIFEECSGFPIDLHSEGLRNAELWTSVAPFLAVAVLLCSVLLVAGCLCCRHSKGFQEFTDSTSSHSLSGTGGYVNNAASNTEFTIFPPLPPSTQQPQLSVPGHTPGDRSSVVRFEPLPDIKPPQPISRRPAAFNNAVSHGLSSQDWFEDPHTNFPRHQLTYLRELGRGWFGRAVEGEAQGIVPGEKTTKVVVKILHEDATPTDHMYFLHEVKPYRDLKHPNILRLLGRCLETDPFLVLLEACPSGDLKSFLSQNVSTAEALSQQGVTLLMGCNIASGLQHMHQHGFVHTDLAARNCLVTSDLTVKIGDYGTSIETFKDDYYCAGEVALPIRWCAPETLFCTETTIETKEVTPGANVWNLGVVLWEICEFGRLPYAELTDDEVIVKVLGEGSYRLTLPSRSCLHRHNLFHLMKLCWSPVTLRPALPQVLAMLNHLYSNREYAHQDGDEISNLKADEDFERRWETFKPNTIPKTDNHLITGSVPILHSPTEEVSMIPPIHVLSNSHEAGIDRTDKFLNESKKTFILPSPSFESSVAHENSNLVSDVNCSTPLTTSPQPSLTSSSGGEFFVPTLQQRHKSPSLQNLRGSLDDLCENNGELADGGEPNSEKIETIQDPRLSTDSTAKEEMAAVQTTEVPKPGTDKSIGTAISEPEFDSWLQGVETTDEEDAKFVRKISEAIRDLDNALALEKTSSSSSSSEASSTSVSNHQSPAKELVSTVSEQNVVLDFRLGPSSSRSTPGIFSPKDIFFQPDSLQDDSLLEKSLPRATDSGTDTEEETWRRRIECGEFSAKVKEKSKSVADLMILTHIECSDGSDSDPPSPTWSFDKNSGIRTSFSKQRRGSSSLNTSSGLAFGSESNIRHAVLGEEFKHTLMKLHEARKDGKIVSPSITPQADRFVNDSPFSKVTFSSEATEPVLLPSQRNPESDFLDNDASETPKPLDKIVLPNDSEEPVSFIGDISLENKSNEINLDSPHIYQVPELENIVTQSGDNVNISHNFSDLCAEKLNVDVLDERPEKSVTLNIPVSSVVDSSNTQPEISEQKCMLDSNSVSKNTPVLATVDTVLSVSGSMHLEDPEDSAELDKSSSIEDPGISLLADRDLFNETDYKCDSPSSDKQFFPQPQFTSTPQIVPTSKECNEPRQVCNVKRNLEFDEPVSEIILDDPSCLSSVDLSASNDSALSSSRTPNRTASDNGTSTDSFDFIPYGEHSHTENSNDKSFSNVAGSANISKVELCSSTRIKPSAQSNSEPSVILGPCEDYTLDFFKGLKTTSEDIAVKGFHSTDVLESREEEEEDRDDKNLIMEREFSLKQVLNNGNKFWNQANCQSSFGSQASSIFEGKEPEFAEQMSNDHIPHNILKLENDLQGTKPGQESITEDKPHGSHTSEEMGKEAKNAKDLGNNDKEMIVTSDGCGNASVIPSQDKFSSNDVEASQSSTEKTAVNSENFHPDIKVITASFLENETHNTSVIELPLTNNESVHKEEDILIYSQEKDTGRCNVEELSNNSFNLLEEKLENIKSDLCVPSLNFVSATPVPSGRSSPEFFVKDVIDVNREESSENQTDKTSEISSNQPEMSSDPVVVDVSIVSSDTKGTDFSIQTSTDSKEVVNDKLTDLSISSGTDFSSRDYSSDLLVGSGSAVYSLSNVDLSLSTLNDSLDPVLSSDEIQSKSEEMIDRLISSLSELPTVNNSVVTTTSDLTNLEPRVDSMLNMENIRESNKKLDVEASESKDSLPLREAKNCTQLDVAVSEIKDSLPQTEVGNLTKLDVAASETKDSLPQTEARNYTKLDTVTSETEDALPQTEDQNYTKLDTATSETEDALPQTEPLDYKKLDAVVSETEDALPQTEVQNYTKLNTTASETKESLPQTEARNYTKLDAAVSEAEDSLPQTEGQNYTKLDTATSETEYALPQTEPLDYTKLDAVASETEDALPQSEAQNYTKLDTSTSETKDSLPQSEAQNYTKLNTATSETKDSLPQTEAQNYTKLNTTASETEDSLLQTEPHNYTKLDTVAYETEDALPQTEVQNHTKLNTAANETKESLPQTEARNYTKLDTAAFETKDSLPQMEVRNEIMSKEEKSETILPSESSLSSSGSNQNLAGTVASCLFLAAEREASELHNAVNDSVLHKEQQSEESKTEDSTYSVTSNKTNSHQKVSSSYANSTADYNDAFDLNEMEKIPAAVSSEDNERHTTTQSKPVESTSLCNTDESMSPKESVSRGKSLDALVSHKEIDVVLTPIAGTENPEIITSRACGLDRVSETLVCHKENEFDLTSEDQPTTCIVETNSEVNTDTTCTLNEPPETLSSSIVTEDLSSLLTLGENSSSSTLEISDNNSSKSLGENIEALLNSMISADKTENNVTLLAEGVSSESDLDDTDIKKKQSMPLAHKTDGTDLPDNIAIVVTRPSTKQMQFNDDSNFEEKLTCSEPKQFCYTDEMSVFVKNIPGKTDDAIEKWKQQNIEILAEDLFQTALDDKHYENKLMSVSTDISGRDFTPRFPVEELETAVELDDDGEEFGLDVAKHSTPDDERSSDSGFRDKGSLSESCEDACDEKYNLEDIEAELEETFNKGGFNYVVRGLEDDDLEHHHGGTDTSEDIRQTPEGELDSTSSPLRMPEMSEGSTFCVEQKSSDKTLEFVKDIARDTTEFSPKSLSLDQNVSYVSVDNMNAFNCKSDISAKTPQPCPENITPDLLNIETSDIPMPDLTVDQRKIQVEKDGISPCEDSPAHTNLKQSDIQSGFSHQKDLILDIGQTEFRAFSPELNTNSFLDSSGLSPIRQMGSGWYLHPPSDARGDEKHKFASGDLLDDVFMSPKSTSSAASNDSKDDEYNDNYGSFSLDEEFVAAIRNELQEKLPCARQRSQNDEPEDDGVIDPEDEFSQEERTDITIHYNVYPPPLSPILEERESVSSITTTISDNFNPFLSTTRENTKQDSDSEPGSPAFIFDSSDPAARETDAKRFEQEIREALENCSISSGETDSSNENRQKSSVLVEDLEGTSSDQMDVKYDSKHVTVVRDTFQPPEYDDDFLVVDTETNQATLLESPKPKSYLAFVNKRVSQNNGNTRDILPSTDFRDEELTVGEGSSGSFFLHSRNVHNEPAIEKASDEEAFTPDSISPAQDRQVPSSSSLPLSDSDNLSGNFPTPDRSSQSTNLDLGLTIPAAYNPYFATSLATQYNHSQGPVYDTVQEISLNLPNNEAAEIISELESSGIFGSCLAKDDVQHDFIGPEPSEESSRTATETNSEAVSLDDNSDSLKSASSGSYNLEKRNLKLSIPTIEQYSVGLLEQNVPETKEECSESTELEDSLDHNGPTRLLLNDTLDLLKKKKALQSSPGAEEKDWSVTSLEAALLSTKAPMPSPEEESWKQIPSMLAFSDLNEVMSRCSNEPGYGDPAFPTSSSPTYPPQENDEDLMSTSFSLKGDSDDLADCYTPDWESESEDTNEEDNNSSSSGEFIWKDGDREASVKAVDMSTSKPYESLSSDFAMEVIAEEEEDEDDDDEEDGSSSSGSGTEFVPSAWNSEATPNRSALRSPDKKVEQKKNVSFKKQKYHCVYEYPREVSDSESEGLESPSRRRWELYQQDVDYSSYADWELMEGDVPETANQELDAEPEMTELQGQEPQTYDFYKLSDVDYDFSSGVMPEDGEFYVSSSSRPFQFSTADNSDIFSGNSSQFFPGQLYRAANLEDCSTDATSTSPHKLSTLGVSVDSCEDEVDTSLPALSSAVAEAFGNKSMSPKHVGSGDVKDRSNVDSSLPLSADDCERVKVSTIPSSSNSAVETKLGAVDNFVDKESDFVETPSPSSPLSPSGLGELRHTRDRLKLDLPASGSPFILDPPALSKRRSVETVKGEASLLDSGEETEDSGIESSNGTAGKRPHLDIIGNQSGVS